jgi:transposase
LNDEQTGRTPDEQLGEPLTPQEIEAFLARYAAGDPVGEIAADFDTSIGTIVRYANARKVRRPSGTARRSRYPQLTEEQLAELRVAYPDKNRTTAEIARAFNVSVDVLAKIAQGQGLRRPK